MTAKHSSPLFLFVSILMCLLPATSIAFTPTSEATFLHHTENGLMIEVEKSDYQAGQSNNVDQTLNWTYNLIDAIYRTAAIADHTYILAGCYLNLPEEAELFTIEGTGVPEWTYSGDDFYTDASDDSTTLAAINVHDTGLDVLKWTSPGTGTPDWTISFAGYSTTGYGPIAVSDDGSTIAIVAAPSGTDARLLLFDANSSTPLINYEAVGLGFPRYIKINADGRYTAFIALATLVVFDRDILNVRDQISMGASNSAMDISGDGDLLAYGWTNMQVMQWTGSSYQTLWSWDSGSYYVTRIAISADGSTIVSCWYTTSFTSVKVVVHDVSSSTPLWIHTYPTSSGTYQESVRDVDVSDDGSLIIVGSLGDAENLNPEVHIFQRDQEPHEIFTVDMPGSVHSVDISGDGNFATACGKHVHDNQMGRGGDIVSITLEGYGELSGALSGTLGPGVFHVVDTIYVDIGDTLQIMPATTLTFDGPYPFNIYGLLLAEGTESDSIIFTTDTTANPDRWRGIRFIEAHDSCRLSYCIIQYGRATGSYPEDRGGGIYCESIQYMMNILISHCLIRYNQANYGGGIGTPPSPGPLSYLTINHTTITNNTADVAGGAIWSEIANLDNCSIIENTASTSGGGLCIGEGTISNCVIRGNSAGSLGGGIYAYTFGADLFENCEFENNSAGSGGAVYYTTMINPTFRKCTFVGNIASGSGGAVYLSSTAPLFENCTFSGNTATGTACIHMPEYFFSTVLKNTIIAHNNGNGSLFFGDSTSIQISYSDFYDNQGGNFTGDIPDSLGLLLTTNYNGDSCDTYFNIFLDPQFVDTAAGDFHLQSTSSCIDAGDPTYPFDPDSTIADIGAFYYHHTPWVGDQPNQTHPSQFYLYPNYPNPFNPVTTITFDLNRTDHVTLKIYNTLGREIATLVDATLTLGTYKVPFTADNLSSGIYFYTLKSTTHTQTRKMVLLK